MKYEVVPMKYDVIGCPKIQEFLLKYPGRT